MSSSLGSDRSTARTGAAGLQPPYLLFAASFLVSLAVAQALLGLVFYSQDAFQATPGQVGWLTGLFALTYSFSCLAVQFHLHRIRPGACIAAATFLLGAVYGGTLLVTNLAGVFWLTGLAGITLCGFWPPLSALFSQGLEGEALNRRISWFNVSWSLGMIIGPLLCGFLSEVSSRLPLLVSAGLAFLTAGLAGARRLRGGPASPPAPAAPAASELAPATEGSTPYRYPAWVGLLAVFFCIGVVNNIFPVAARTRLLFTESLIGLLLFFRPLLNTLGFFLMGRTTFWHFRGWPMLATQLLGALVMTGLVFVRTPVGIGIMIAGLGLAGAAGYANSIFHGLSGSSRRGGRMAIQESVANLGAVCGCVIGGAVCQAYAIGRVYWICAGVSLAALAIQGALLSRIRNR